MFEELNTFLLDNVSPEEYDLLSNVYSIMDQYFSIEVQNDINNIILSTFESNTDTYTPITELKAYFTKSMYDFLAQHDIQIVEDTNLDILLEFSQAILLIQDCDLCEDICDIIESEEFTDGEKLAEILSLVSEFEPEKFLLYIDSVDEVLFKKLQDLMWANREEGDNEIDITPYIEEIKLFTQFIGFDTLVVDKIRQGLKPGYKFKTYLNLINVGEDFSLDALAIELYASALISSDGINNTKGVISNVLDDLVQDLKLITKVDVKVTDIMLQYQKFKDEL